jgi:hypothetical protein
MKSLLTNSHFHSKNLIFATEKNGSKLQYSSQKSPKQTLTFFHCLLKGKKNSIQAKSKDIKPPKTSKTSPSSNKRSKDERPPPSPPPPILNKLSGQSTQV